MNNNIKKIDCLGEICPIPIIKIQNNLEEIKNGRPVMVLTDHSCTLVSVADFCKKHSLTHSSTEVINGVWEIVISR